MLGKCLILSKMDEALSAELPDAALETAARKFWEQAASFYHCSAVIPVGDARVPYCSYSTAE